MKDKHTASIKCAAREDRKLKVRSADRERESLTVVESMGVSIASDLSASLVVRASLLRRRIDRSSRVHNTTAGSTSTLVELSGERNSG